jgi:triosephosphate isomerase
MQKIVIGNWKMYGEPAMAANLSQAVVKEAQRSANNVKVILCPPAPLLYTVAGHLSKSTVKLGGQDCHIQPEGAYTGDISANMLKQAGCNFVLLGHSERRKYHLESSRDVSLKAARAIKAGLIPVICIGETGEEHAAGKTKDVLAEQIRESIPEEAVSSDFMLAYEPVWAIGSGKTPTIDDISEIHTYIRAFTSKRTGMDIDRIYVLYGGSVKSDNARDIMAIPSVSGVLVGGASLKEEEFCRIIAAAS